MKRRSLDHQRNSGACWHLAAMVTGSLLQLSIDLEETYEFTSTIEGGEGGELHLMQA